MPRFSLDSASSQDQKLQRSAMRQQMRAQQQAGSAAQQGAMLQQLRALYDLGQEDQMSPLKTEAARLANAGARAQLDFMPQENAAKLAESGARVTANQAQADYYGAQGKHLGDVDPRMLEWMTPDQRSAAIIGSMPSGVKEIMQAAQAKKEAEHAAAVAADQQQQAQGGVGPQGPGVNEGHPGRALQDLLGGGIYNIGEAGSRAGRGIVTFIDDLLGTHRPSPGTPVPFGHMQPLPEDMPFAPLAPRKQTPVSRKPKR